MSTNNPWLDVSNDRLLTITDIYELILITEAKIENKKWYQGPINLSKVYKEWYELVIKNGH